MIDKTNQVFTNRLGILETRFSAHIKQAIPVIYSLIFIAVCSYGFELFNLNLTIDEEIYANTSEPLLEWITQGRWGMYLLNKFLFPYSVLPFVPLFTALIFHIGAILLMLNAWDVNLKVRDQIIIGSIGIAFPTLAYIYTFSTINYGIGFGFLCIALSLFLYKERGRYTYFLAIIPAAFAIAIYQGFIPAIISAFLIYIINKWIVTGHISKEEIFAISGIHLGAIIVYLCIHYLLHFFVTFPDSNYISQYFAIDSFISNFFSALNKTFITTGQAYFGDASIYAMPVKSLPYLLGVSLIGLGLRIFKSKSSWLAKISLILLSLGLLMLPFAVGILLRGGIAIRFLTALPIVAAGIIFLGLNNKNKLLETAILLFTLWTVFQFVITTNHLFASSHLALQADRVLASQLMERMELAKSEAATPQVKYLEVIGFIHRQPTLLMPQTGTFGASFFEWNQGNTSRILRFFQTLGYGGLQAAPPKLRIQMIEHANTMPLWPEKESVQIVGDVLLVKFGPYSHAQKQQICQTMKKQIRNKHKEFCE